MKKELNKAIVREEPNALKIIGEEARNFIKKLNISFEKDSNGFNLKVTKRKEN